MPVITTPATPTTTPVISPGELPYWERHTMPDETCPQQRRELASPDVEP